MVSSQRQVAYRPCSYSSLTFMMRGDDRLHWVVRMADSPMQRCFAAAEHSSEVQSKIDQTSYRPPV